jgi:hypothetical protein
LLSGPRIESELSAFAKLHEKSEKITKKISASKIREGRSSKDLRSEYDFDYAKARPNRFARRAREKSVVVLLAPDVAKVFKNGESVNAAVRAILRAVPRRKAAANVN